MAAATAASSMGVPGAMPSSTAPMAGPWLSPNNVRRTAAPQVSLIVLSPFVLLAAEPCGFQRMPLPTRARTSASGAFSR